MKRLAKLFLVIALTVVNALPVAAVTPSQAFISAYKLANNPFGADGEFAGYTAFVAGNSDAQVEAQIRKELADSYPISMEGNPFIPVCYVRHGQTVGYLSNSYLKTLEENEQFYLEWLKGINSIVPQGTPETAIVKTVADWEINNIGYDFAYQEDDNFSQSFGMIALKTGKAVCASYSDVFAKVVDHTPINPVTGLVDYNCKTPRYMRAYIITTPKHAYNRVGNRYIDVTNYFGSKLQGCLNPAYLNMTPAMMDDSDYR